MTIKKSLKNDGVSRLCSAHGFGACARVHVRGRAAHPGDADADEYGRGAPAPSFRYFETVFPRLTYNPTARFFITILIHPLTAI